jgi:predicted Holliday junction resolvase-like endonuclease
LASSITAAFKWLNSNMALIVLVIVGIVVVLVVGAQWVRRQEQKALEARRAQLIQKYRSEAIVERILNSEFWQGQSEEQLLDALGHPVARDKKVMKTRRREVWKYHERGRDQFALRITLENGKVSGWDKKQGA